MTGSREQRALIALWTLPGIGPTTVGRVIARFGSVDTALAASPAELSQVLPLPARPFARRLTSSEEIADEVLRAAERASMHLLFRDQPGWPRQLADPSFTPPLLFVRGALPPSSVRVGIVGSRETDSYGREVAAFLGGALAAAGVSVVSGGAVGVDSAAHAAAVEAGQTTVVLGCGADVVYPRLNRKLFDRILMNGGALVSTFSPQTPPCQQNFPVRNRVLAALCDAVVVARAGRESGALMTARAAHKMGKPVFAVCGRLGESQSQGVTKLIREGVALPIDGPEDILAALGQAPRPTKAAPTKRTTTSRRVLPPVPKEFEKVMAALELGPRPIDEIAAASGLNAPSLASALTELEMLGLCEARIGGVFAAVPSTAFDCATDPV